MCVYIYIYIHMHIYNLTFFLTFFLTFYLKSILRFYLASILRFYLASILTFFLTSYLTFYLASILRFYLASILTFFLTFYPWHTECYLVFFMAFSLACVQVQVWPTASGAGDMEFGFRRGAQHPELAIWSSGPGMAHRMRSPPHGSERQGWHQAEQE